MQLKILYVFCLKIAQSLYLEHFVCSYEDLKPPTSPSPLPPITRKQSEELSLPDVLVSEVNASSVTVSDAETAEEITPSIDLTEAKSIEVKKTQPLSPYTM